MKFLLWERRFETGIDEIDDVHKHEFDFINRVHKSIVEKDPREQIEQLMQSLIEHVRAHFEGEEKEMKERGYSRLDIHVKEHQQMLDQLRGYYQKYLEKEDAAAYDFLEYLHGWFIHHLEGEDRELGDFLVSSDS